MQAKHDDDQDLHPSTAAGGKYRHALYHDAPRIDAHQSGQARSLSEQAGRAVEKGALCISNAIEVTVVLFRQGG